jgi:RimJ/RimL family protein N-acetyltransferase
MKDEPVILEGEHVRLEPLSLSHLADLCEIGLDEDIWRWSPEQISTPAQLQAYIDDALRDQEAGTAVPFATVLKNEGRTIGSTRFCAIEPRHRRLEIGWTWIGTAWQRSVVNTEAKYLMLRHAFETLGCIRVELKTDSLNQHSRNAILRIGAKEEGTFRNHMVTQSGRLRHSVFFSIIDSEWPEVKASLEEKLSR